MASAPNSATTGQARRRRRGPGGRRRIRQRGRVLQPAQHRRHDHPVVRIQWRLQGAIPLALEDPPRRPGKSALAQGLELVEEFPEAGAKLRGVAGLDREDDELGMGGADLLFAFG